MKAKLKKTGELINIADYSRITLNRCDSYGNPIELGLDEIERIFDDDGITLGMPKIQNNSILQVEDSIDWEQRRYEIAKDMLPVVSVSVDSYWDRITQKEAATEVVSYADALIEELKKEKKQ